MNEHPAIPPAPAPSHPSPTALAGVKVIDLSRILAGPSATQLLGDLGADVIKIEKPAEGDDTRRWGPPWITGADGQPTDESAYYLSANRNKRSIAIDLGNDEGRRLVRRLIGEADVLVENHKTGGLAQYGLDYETLKTEFPALIYCSITGFGQTGPYANRPGYDFLVQGMGGIMSLTGEPDGKPMKVGVGIADVMTGMYATVGILAALHRRSVSGHGQHIDISLLDSQIAWLVNGATNYLADGIVPRRLGNGHPNIAPYQVFLTADAPMILAVGNDAQFARFCSVAGLEALPQDDRFSTNAARVAHRDALATIIDAALGKKGRAHWLSRLEEAAVPAGPVNDLAAVFDDPQVKYRGAQLRMPCDWAADGELRLLANPLKLSDSPVSYRRTPPRLDEHRAEILRDWLSGCDR